MKSRFAVMAIALLCATSSFGQMRWGVEAGVNFSHGYDTDKSKVGFNVGATGEYSINTNWFLDASLKLSSQPCGFSSLWGEYQDGTNDYVSPDHKDTGNFTPYYLTLPVRAGYKFNISNNTKLSFAVGPMIGVGLFGKGNIKSENLSTKSTAVDTKTNSIFSTTEAACFASSRLEYGANVKAALEFNSHYTVGVEYSIMHIPGTYKVVKNIGTASLNIGYKF